MLSALAIVLGIVFLLLGILGFVPQVLRDGYLFGVFHLNLIHNCIHLASGVIALWVGFTSNYASKIYFQVFGIIYAFVAALGFIYGTEDILGLIANNAGDTWLHLVIAVVSLYFGFILKSSQSE